MRHFMRNREFALCGRIGFGEVLRHRDIAFEQTESERASDLIGRHDADTVDIGNIDGVRQQVVAHRCVADHLNDKEQGSAAEPKRHAQSGPVDRCRWNFVCSDQHLIGGVGRWHS